MTIGWLRAARAPASERVLRAAPRARLAVAVAVAVVITFASGLSRTERLGLITVVLAYAALSTGFGAAGRRRPQIPVRGPTAAAGIAAVFVATLILPGFELASLVIYALTVTAYTCVGGRALGLALVAVVIPAALIAAWLTPPGDRLDAWTLAGFVALLPVLVGVADGLTRRHRRTVERLAQLHDALQAVAVTPDLQATLDAVADSARDAVEAFTAAVYLRTGQMLRPASTRGAPDVWTEQPAHGTADPIASCASRAARVVVGDVTDDGRYAEWARSQGRAMRRAGVVGLAAVPIRLRGDTIGVLSAGVSRGDGLGRHEVALLATHAEQAALVIVRAQAYERERRAREELAAADRRKAEFLGIVSHELRTPLTAVKGFVDTVLLHWDRLPDERRRDLLARASGNADDLDRLVGQLLDFARIEAERVRIEPQALDAGALVEGVVASLAPALSGHHVEVAVPARLALTADDRAVRQVLTNLLTNAAKFSPAGSRVRISARAADGEVVLSVADEGPGVAPEDRERVFERFYQVDGSGAGPRGAGIGLTIAKRFTELHGGRIWVRPGPGGGAVFSCALPAGAAVAATPQAVGARP